MRRNSLFVLWAAVLAISACGGSKDKSKSELEVTSTPTGEVEGALRVVLTFSRPMVAADAVGQVSESSLISFAPPLPGEAKWQDPQTLVFVPGESVPVSTGYRATVAKGIKALDGQRLLSNYSFEFETERLSAKITILGSAERAQREQLIKIVFNHEVESTAVEKNCHYVSGSDTRAVKRNAYTTFGPGKIFTVMPVSELSTDSDWQLRCGSALSGVVGNLGLRDEVSQAFHTFGPLHFVSLEPSGEDIVPTEGLQLAIAFTNPLKPPYQMSLSPKVTGFPERCHSLGDAPAGLSCGVMLDPRTFYTLKIEADQEDVFGQKLGKEQTLNFRTTDAEPTISMDSGYFIAELKRPVLPVWTRNVKSLNVRALPVTPSTFHKIRPSIDWWQQSPAAFQKQKVIKRTIKVDAKENTWHQVALDPAEFLGSAAGPGMYYVEVGSSDVTNWPFQDGGVKKTLVNFTDIGVVSKLSPSKGLVWATQLSTGKSLAGAEVSVRNLNGKVTWSGRTDAEGVAILPGYESLQGKKSDEEQGSSSMRIFVSQGNDWTMIDPDSYGGLSAWNFNVSMDYSRSPQSLRGFMHTERGLYRPGEKLYLKGLARVSSLGSSLSVPKDNKVSLELMDPRGTVIHSEELKLSKFGGFWTEYELAGDARLGDYTMRATLANGVFTENFSVEEYRPASFEVSGKLKKPRIVRRGALEASILAKYFYGAPLREGEVSVTVHARPRQVSFDNHEGFDFSDERKYYSEYNYSSSYSQELVTEDKLVLDSKGNANLAVSIAPSDVRSDADLLVRASVSSPANEVISKTFTVPYFRSRRYFGIKSPGYFLDVKKPATFEVVGVTPDGKAVNGEAKVRVTKRDWNCVWEDWGYRGSYQCKENIIPVLEQSITMSGGKPASFTFTPESGGNYWVVVEGLKDTHAQAAQQLYAWGDGGGSWQSSDSLTFDIVSDKKEYKDGDTATLILKTDLAQATGLVTIERDGIIEKRFIDITPSTKHLKIPIEAKYAPNVYVSVALVQGRMGEGTRGKPRMRMGLINLPVRPEDNTLKVSVKTDKKDYRPGAPVKATIKITDQAGQPVSAEVAVTAADEGVLSLIGYQTPNPTPTFYSPWGIAVATSTQFSYIKDIPGPNMQRPATGGDAGGPGSVRSRFMSTAVWKPGIVTNDKGLATVEFAAPDNLTAFRVMAVAADKGYRFGSSDKRFTVSKPLQLHRLLPRFLTNGDTLQGGVVVHNETKKAGTATVRLKHDGLLTVAGETTQTLSVAAGARVPVLFILKAAAVGTSAMTFSVDMNGEEDAVQFSLPIHEASPLRKLHIAHGTTTGTKSVAIALPANAIASTAKLYVSVDPDGLAGIEEGLRELIGYPYGCLEQTTSKVIPMLAVRGITESLNLKELAGTKLDSFVEAGIAKIGKHQSYNGGYSLWQGGEADAYNTAYALWALYLAKQAGYRVDQSRIDDGLYYLREQGKRPPTSAPYYDESGNLGNQAFALYVRAMLGDKDGQAAAELRSKLSDIPVYGQAFLVRALAADLGPSDPVVVAILSSLSALAKSAVAKGELIDSGKDLYYYMSNDVRTTAIVLDTLVALAPKDEAIKGLVFTLMKKRRGSAYQTTQGNLYSLLALNNYAGSRSGAAPKVVVTFGEKELIDATLKGASRLQLASADAPATGGTLDLRSQGEAHYNIELHYRQKPETLKGESNGLTVSREYLDEAGKAKTTFKVGDMVRVRLTLPLSESVSHLMVSDRIPAGFEALNTRLKTVGTAGMHQTREYWGGYREMHDERVDFSSEYNWRSTYVREYMIRAIAEGHFAVPPTHAELMYEPEKNAQNAMTYIDIKAK